MSTFDRLSRYVKPPLEPYAVADIRGREVRALPTPEPPVEQTAGTHVKKQGQTLDQLANGYLADPHAYWRIAELNEAILPDALAEVETLEIPAPVRR